MRLYYAPGACSLASNIALREAKIPFAMERVDLKSKATQLGSDYRSVTEKGYVPALVLDSGEVVTENIAVLDYIASIAPALAVDGDNGRTRQLEMLAYISTELHKSFKPFFTGGSEADNAKAGAYIIRRMRYLADGVLGDFLFGGRPGVCDFYLFVTMRWAGRFGIAIPSRLMELRDLLEARPAVQAAMRAEGWG
ncbi:MAG: glutathione S-transferase [Parvibaculaceae bacterium]